MREGDNVRLELNEFVDNIRTFWQGFQDETDFCDVTLACEDKQIRTHKMIISSCSPVLKNILKLHQNPHPVIYLTKVKFKDLQNMLHFMYQGEVDVAKEDLPSFLEVAEDLLIKGLSEENVDGGDLDKVYLQDNHQNKISSPKRKRTGKNIESIHDTNFVGSSSELLMENINFNDHHEFEAQQKVDGGDLSNTMNLQNNLKVKRTKKMIENLHDTNFVSSLSESLMVNKNFNDHHKFEAQQNEIKQEIKSEKNTKSLVTRDGIEKLKCETCDGEFASRSVLFRHIRSVHEGVRHHCDQCDFKAKQMGHLKDHMQSIHEGVRHSCNLCDYEAKRKDKLKEHVLKKHN